MSRLYIPFGLFCIIAAVAFIIFQFVGAETDFISKPLEAIACTPHETLVIERDQWSMPNGERGESLYYFCEIEPGQRRNVGDTVIPVMMVFFFVLLGAGFIFIFKGAAKSAGMDAEKLKSIQQDRFSPISDQPYTTSRPSTVINIHGDLNSISPEKQEKLNQLFGDNIDLVSKASNAVTLSDRLEQLNEAYNNDLISKEEYDRIRQAILDSMDD